MTDQTGADLRAQAAELVDAAAERHRWLTATAKQFSAAEQQWREMAVAQVQQLAEQAQAGFEVEAAGIRQRAAETQTAVVSALDRESAAIAAGPMSSPWSAPEWSRIDSDLRPRSVSWVRVGSLKLPYPESNVEPVPALVPLLDHAGWSVGGSAEDFAALVQAVLLRLYSTVPLHRLEVAIFDPAMELQVGLFAPLREAARRSLAPTATAPDDFGRALEAMVAGMVRTTDELSNLGVTNVHEHWKTIGSLELTYRVIIVNSYPQAVTPQINETLLQIARTGGTRGVSLIVHSGTGSSASTGATTATGRGGGGVDLAPRELTSLLTAMNVTSTVLSVASLPEARVSNDGAPARAMAEATVAGIVGASGATSMPSLPLKDIIDEIPGRWSDAEFSGLAAPYGRVGRRPLELRLRSADPPLPNALIGGATGQGKSNLLLAILHGLAARYRPDELRMYLLDFRQGVELSSLGPTAEDPTWLPHAEVLGLESDREFGMAVLEYLVAQFQVRSNMLTAAGAKSIVDYREDGGTAMPRLLLVIDEFQMLFEGEDEIARRSVDLVEQIARQGRGYGVHMILASQTISGIRGLSVKGDAIFGQFPTRLSLKNTPAESEAILGRGNKSAAELAYRGEIIANDNFGRPDDNVRGVVALADDDYLEQLRRELWENSAPHESGPFTFYGARSAAWTDIEIRALRSRRHDPAVISGTYRLWAGVPIGVRAEPAEIAIAREGDQGVLLLGSGETEAAGVLSSMMASINMSGGKSSRWIVLDGLTRCGLLATEADQMPQWLEAAIAMATAAGNTVQHYDRDEVRGYLIGEGANLVAQQGPDSPDTFVFLLAPQRVTGLETPETIGAEYINPADTLRTLIREGSPRGVFTIAWWLNRRSAESMLGYAFAGIGAHVLFGLAREEMQGLIDVRYPLPQGNPRIVMKDARSRPEVRTAIPFTPLTSSVVDELLGANDV